MYLKLPSKLRSALTLPPAAVLAAGRAWLVLARVDLTVSLLPYRCWRRKLLTAMFPGDLRDLNRGARLPVLLHSFSLALRNYPRPQSCLRRSLALHHYLKSHGTPATLLIGTRRNDNDTMAGHAWLESGGHVINDVSDVRSSYEVINDTQTAASTLSPASPVGNRLIRQSVSSRHRG